MDNLINAWGVVGLIYIMLVAVINMPFDDLRYQPKRKMRY